MPKRSKPLKKLFSSRALLLTAAVVVVIASLFWIFHGSKPTTKIIPSNNPSNTASADAPKKAESTPASSSSSSGSQPAVGTEHKDQAPAPSSGGLLKTPYGDFVSNHMPGQNGSGTAESSTCITTPGATCYIKLTKGSETKLLETRTTDNSGTAYWSWDANSLSSGNWTVSAVASLNGETKSAQDAKLLVVE